MKVCVDAGSTLRDSADGAANNFRIVFGAVPQVNEWGLLPRGKCSVCRLRASEPIDFGVLPLATAVAFFDPGLHCWGRLRQ
jgi:hypothetical protein